MRRLLTLTAILATSVVAFSQQPDYEASQVKITGGPYLQNVTPTSFTVVWQTNVDAVAWVEVAPDDGKHFYHEDRPCYYDERGFGRKPIGTLHQVTVSGLKPGETYRYMPNNKGLVYNGNRTIMIFDSGFNHDLIKSNLFSVTTLKEDYDHLSFATVNDIHEQTENFEKLLKNAGEKFDFIVFNGDMTSAVDSEADLWKYYLNSSSKLFAAEIPLYLVRGNHEYRGNDAIKYASDYFATPTGKTYYTYSYGPFFFIVLDGGEDKPLKNIRNLDIMITDQYVDQEVEWLRKVIESDEYKKADVHIAFCHIVPESDGWYGAGVVYDKLVPVLNEGGIDLMYSAHIHQYKYIAPGERNNTFPIVVNPHCVRMDSYLTREKVDIKFFNPDGTMLRSQTVKFK